MTKSDVKTPLKLAVTSAPPSAKGPPPPAHLSDDAASWWRSVVADFDLEDHHLRLLQSACEAWDRMQQARQAIADHGSVIATKANGDLVAHPAIAIERDARIGFARLVRELDLDTGAPAERSRPPSLGSNRR
jgi:P27 family predicted phage terminase small subunit